MLADYAVRVENSRGRRHPEPPHAYRNDFQRDRDRSFTPAPFGGWKRRRRSSPAVIPITSATG